MDPHVLVAPGSKIQLDCTFANNVPSNGTQFGYQFFFDDMCFAFVTFYPADKLNSYRCHQFGNSSLCRVDRGEPKEIPVAVSANNKTNSSGGCDILKFSNESHPETAAIFAEVMGNCEACTTTCSATLDSLRSHPCLSDDFIGIRNWYLSSGHGRKFITTYETCKDKVVPDPELEITTKLPIENGSTRGFQDIILSCLASLFILCCL